MATRRAARPGSRSSSSKSKAILPRARRATARSLELVGCGASTRVPAAGFRGTMARAINKSTFSAGASARSPRRSQARADNDVSNSDHRGSVEGRVARRTFPDTRTMRGLQDQRPTETEDRKVEEALFERKRRARVRGGQGGAFRAEDGPDPTPDRRHRYPAKIPRAGVKDPPCNAPRENGRSLNVHPVESDAKSPGRVDDGRRVPGRCRA